MITEDQVREALGKSDFPEGYGESFAGGLIRGLRYINPLFENLYVTPMMTWMSWGVHDVLRYDIAEDVLYPALERFVSALFEHDEARRAIALQAVQEFRNIFG